MKSKAKTPQLVYDYPTADRAQQHCYAVRTWDDSKGQFLYLSQHWTKKRGHTLRWAPYSRKIQMSTGLLSIMFTAQAHARKEKLKWGTEVVIMDEVIVWHSHHSNRKLTLEAVNDPNT